MEHHIATKTTTKSAENSQKQQKNVENTLYTTNAKNSLRFRTILDLVDLNEVVHR